ncbi:glycosyl-4,4'-diaponeurosporenoate acyltransferase CrtO family protein [Planococcus lenghuensis]|uniref:Glycosyl-4,4'-diaponeurosporenoate acyltransferase n=1 Tax=Planococcus lenghuensis TaxID=2213202 RepID=A0A1Q2KVH2_9BACL|nr:glycosyl-4,4'-diaponeurosporenoate acyltransferase [Planococcus lenghuensis]AQQ51807.1 glycosyl-4,4'-diaponeurosporenoate acyltransferase [Planococcus lenghuensis]
MPIIEFSFIWILTIDIAAWTLLHLGISTALLSLPADRFTYDTAVTRIHHWEQEGEIWQQIFGIKHWKDRLPDGSSIFRKGFQKKRLSASSEMYLNQFIVESRRAEWTHWLLIPPSLIFFLWNPIWAGWIMVIYALAVNIPFILIQRYNRPRLQRLADRITDVKPKSSS